MQVSKIVPLQAIALRLSPGQDLQEELLLLMQQQEIAAACVMTCVGSLEKVALRMANRSEATYLEDKYEITSLEGTLSSKSSHLHLSLSDGTGAALGGHVLRGCIIYTTAEIVLGVLPDLQFERKLDPASGYQELFIEPESLIYSQR